MAEIPLVLVPGLLCTEELWRAQLPALAPVAEVRVAHEQTEHDTIAGMARAILDAAPPRFALAGLSMGGIVAFEIMRAAPGRVTRLALLDTLAHAAAGAEEAAVRQGRMDMAARGRFREVVGLQLARFIPGPRLADRALVDRIIAMCETVGPEAYARQERAVLARADSRGSLGAIACPTLVLCGRQDAATPLAWSELIAAGVPGAKLVVVEDCGHLSTMEQPEPVNRALAAWLAA
ncbi:MAG: alpha/beta fold hydrolase [Alphaproteobacteria bacterium]|nr:alpha/beta fold hydrolase [Alphaproteobacteria bacterium]